MNKFITTIKALDYSAVSLILEKEPKCTDWQEADGKNALHFLGGVATRDDKVQEAIAVKIVKHLLQKAMDINAIHAINDRNCIFPATPLWYAYTRGRNKQLYTWLLEHGANPDNCMFAIAWYNDVEAANLFKKHGADIDGKNGDETPFLSAFNWKRYNIAEWFLQHGANVNAVDNKGNSALFNAVKRKSNPEQINLLLKFGADIHQQNHDGVSPQKLAEQNHQRNILTIFSQ